MEHLSKKRPRHENRPCTRNKINKSKEKKIKGVVLPGIPGAVVPFLLDAIKLQKKLLSKEMKLNQSHPSALNKTTNHGEPGNVINDIMLRMKKGEKLVDEQSPDAKLLEELRRSVHHSLKCLMKNILDNSLKSSNVKSISKNCFKFLIDMVQDAKCKSLLRRASLRVIHILLQSSRVCRDFFAGPQDFMLTSYVSTIADINTQIQRSHSQTLEVIEGKEADSVDRHSMKLKHEAVELLVDLENNHSHSYPKLAVALKILREQKGFIISYNRLPKKANHVESSLVEDPGSKNIMQLRQIRDTALKLGANECARIQKLLQITQKCFDALVPRIADFNSEITLENKHNNSDQTPPKDNEDENSIDWEDGFESEDDNRDCGDDHVAAVESTLAVMESTRATLNGGISVDFGVRDEGSNHTSKILTSNKITLNKLVTRLSKQKLRLEIWIDGLKFADNMVEKKSYHQTSTNSRPVQMPLILLPVSKRQLRGYMLKKLMDVNHDIIGVLNSAAKLEIFPENNN